MIKKKLVFNLLLIIATIIAGYLALIIQSQLISNKILFQPPSDRYVDNSSIIKLTTLNGNKISATYLPNPNSKFVILYSHGNATDLGKLYPLLKEFQAHGFAIFAYDYQGYGTSEGDPSERNTYLDVEASYNYLTQTLHIPPSRIVAMGTSLGAAVTVDIAARKPVAGAILEAPFLSAYRVFTIIPLLPFDKYNVLNKIKYIHVPILIIHGVQDETIPVWHGKRLFLAIKGTKQSLFIQNAGHNDLLLKGGATYWQTIKQFFTSLTN